MSMAELPAWLTERQRQVVELREQGYSMNRVATELGISVERVREIIAAVSRRQSLPGGLSELNVPQWVAGALDRALISREDLKTATDEQLLKIENLGPKGLYLVDEALIELGTPRTADSTEPPPKQLTATERRLKGDIVLIREKQARLRYQLRTLIRQHTRLREEVQEALTELRAGDPDAAQARLGGSLDRTRKDPDRTHLPEGANRKKLQREAKARRAEQTPNEKAPE